MSKSILTLDEINLLKQSEEPKDSSIYGNLFDVLNSLKYSKAVTLNDLYDLNEKAKNSLIYNKDLLMANVSKEWYAQRVIEESPTKKVYCGLCNTPNKYLYFIRNRKNNNTLNVGSSCIKKFPDIEGYTEQKQQLNDIKKNKKVIERRLEFNSSFPNVKQLISNNRNYFNNIPILLPEELYNKLDKATIRLSSIYNTYVNDEKNIFETKMTPIELFKYTLNKIYGWKNEAEEYVNSNKFNENICKREEINWLLKNNMDHLLHLIAENNGYYSLDTIKFMYSSLIFKRYFKDFNKCSACSQLKFRRYKKDTNSMIFLATKNYNNPIVLNVSFRNFIKNIGNKCIFVSNYLYKDIDILSISKIINSYKNLESVIDYCSDIFKKIGYIILIDYSTNNLIILRKSDKSIFSIDYSKFLALFKPHLLNLQNEISQFSTNLVTNKNIRWITADRQFKLGIDEKIRKLYKEQYENY